MNEYIRNIIYNAHACLNVNDPKDKNVVVEAIEMINNIDVLITDDDILKKIKTKKNMVENQYNKDTEAIKNITDPFGHGKEELKNLKWKLKELISFYNKLNNNEQIL